jgi:hypothetical protein
MRRVVRSDVGMREGGVRWRGRWIGVARWASFGFRVRCRLLGPARSTRRRADLGVWIDVHHPGLDQLRAAGSLRRWREAHSGRCRTTTWRFLPISRGAVWGCPKARRPSNAPPHLGNQLPPTDLTSRYRSANSGSRRPGSVARVGRRCPGGCRATRRRRTGTRRATADRRTATGGWDRSRALRGNGIGRGRGRNRRTCVTRWTSMISGSALGRRLSLARRVGGTSRIATCIAGAADDNRGLG